MGSSKIYLILALSREPDLVASGAFYQQNILGSSERQLQRSIDQLSAVSDNILHNTTTTRLLLLQEQLFIHAHTFEARKNPYELKRK